MNTYLTMMRIREQFAAYGRPGKHPVLHILLGLLLFCVLGGSLVVAQNYQCNWSVVDIGGGLMSSAGFRALPSAGQTATGIIAGTAYQAHIGFWQIDTGGVGIREDARWSVEEPLETRLYEPAPNPCFGNALIRYSLATETRVNLQVYDLAGRSRAVLVNSVQKPGRYFSHLDAALARGICFIKLRANDYQATRKLVIQ